MKRIINGRIYDTETAKCIAVQKDEDIQDGFTLITCSKIYQKNNGEFFEYFYNQAKIECADSVVRETEEARRCITPLNFDGVNEWLELCGQSCYKAEGFDMLKQYAAQSKPEINELKICD